MQTACFSDHAALLDAAHHDFQPHYLFFWGHTSRNPDELGKECLSQWYPARFTVDGQTYANAEHFMMAGKAGYFGDDETRRRILAAHAPAEVKRLGREVRGFDESQWQKIRFDLVVTASLEKFRQNPVLRDFLAGTGQRVLVEASPVDRIWGIGLSADDPQQWNELNLLGFSLMIARERLKNAEQSH